MVVGAYYPALGKHTVFWGKMQHILRSLKCSFPRYLLGDTVGKGHAHPGQPKMARLQSYYGDISASIGDMIKI